MGVEPPATGTPTPTFPRVQGKKQTGPMLESRQPRIVILYHYFHPDDVVSARHFGDLAEGLAARGWAVEAQPCNRGRRDESLTYKPKEVWHGVQIRRVWRPRLKQASAKGRIINALWMIAAWSLLAFRRGKRQPDVVLVGTDPILSVLVAGVIRFLNPRIKLVHWAFDLYPEAAVADGLFREESFLIRTIKRFLRWSYRACDLIVDIGPCMRRRIAEYLPAPVSRFAPRNGALDPRETHNASVDDPDSAPFRGAKSDTGPRAATLVPWALAEPAAV